MSQADELYKLGPILARVLSIAKEVARQLHISKFNPRKVTLVERASPDFCSFIGRHHRQMIVQATTAEKLDPEEWRPLIVSSLIYSKSKTKLFLKAVVLTLAPGAALGVFLDNPFVLLIPIVLLAVVLSQLLSSWDKKNLLSADRETEKLLGNGTLLQVLKKIEVLSPRFRKPRFSTGSTITERVENLTVRSSD